MDFSKSKLIPLIFIVRINNKRASGGPLTISIWVFQNNPKPCSSTLQMSLMKHIISNSLYSFLKAQTIEVFNKLPMTPLTFLPSRKRMFAQIFVNAFHNNYYVCMYVCMYFIVNVFVYTIIQKSK